MPDHSAPPPPLVHALFVYLAVRDGARAVAFYTAAFGAVETLRLAQPDGRIAHAELKLGPATLMLADERPEAGFNSPVTLGGTGTLIHLHVANVDVLTARAVAAGATVLRAPRDEGHGERQAKIRDPFGHEWLLGHELEPGSPEELKRRFEASA
jgi:uncharacterized glyoxalase superfamily protein PhnB